MDYNKAKEVKFSKSKAAVKRLNVPLKSSYTFADTVTWQERVYLHYSLAEIFSHKMLSYDPAT